MISIELILVRHGQTEKSAVRALSGRTDVDLNEEGERQAVLVAGRLARHQGRPILTSPARRCRATAAAVAARNGGDVTVVEELSEVDYGEWEGLTTREVKERDAEAFARWQADPTVAPPGGESAMDHAHRVIRARDRCVELGPAIVVSHAFTIKQVIRLVLDVPFAVMPRIIVQPASLNVVEFDSIGLGALVTLNDVQHLEADEGTP